MFWLKKKKIMGENAIFISLVMALFRNSSTILGWEFTITFRLKVILKIIFNLYFCK